MGRLDVQRSRTLLYLSLSLLALVVSSGLGQSEIAQSSTSCSTAESATEQGKGDRKRMALWGTTRVSTAMAALSLHHHLETIKGNDKGAIFVAPTPEEQSAPPEPGGSISQSQIGNVEPQTFPSDVFASRFEALWDTELLGDSLHSIQKVLHDECL